MSAADNLSMTENTRSRQPKGVPVGGEFAANAHDEAAPMRPKTGHPFTLTEPCKKCPFRTDSDAYLRPERYAEIATSLNEGSDFTCHQTVDYGEDDDGMSTESVGARGRMCAGAMATLENQGTPTQNMRIAERMGLYDATKLEDAPVYDSLAEWVKAKGGVPTVTDSDGTVVELEHCGVVSANCEDPAGFATGGGATANPALPTCNPLTDECEACGSVMCGGCRSENDPTFCVFCVEDEDEDSDG